MLIKYIYPTIYVNNSKREKIKKSKGNKDIYLPHFANCQR